MKRIALLAITAFLLVSCQSNGQQKTKANLSKPALSNVGAKEVILDVPEKEYTGLKPGDIAPDAISVDADHIGPIVNGACVLTKGNQQAVIDLKGNFLVNWSNSEIKSFAPYSTLFVQTNFIDVRLVNTKGQAVLPNIKMHHTTSIDARKFINTMVGTNQVFINQNGRIMPEGFVSHLEKFGQRELYNKPQSSLMKIIRNHQCGFSDLNGKIVIAPQFDDAGEFTDGLAPVMKIDQFGAAKWGYINEAGKMTIPYTYQIIPGQFHNGLALVQPVDKSEFKYAFIDKTGAIKFKLPLNAYLSKTPNPSDYSTADGSFVDGYAFWRVLNDEKLLDTFGNLLDISSLLKYAYVRPSDNTGFSLDGYNDKGIFFSTSQRALVLNKQGMIDWKGKLLFPPVFEYIRPDFFSTYAIAGRKVSGNGFEKDKGVVAGVVNSKGIFVLTLAPKAKF